MMRALNRHRDRLRRATAWLTLGSIAALPLLTAASFGEGLLVSEYTIKDQAAAGDDQSDGWYIIEDSASHEPMFSAGCLRGANGQNGLEWHSTGGIDAVVVGRGYWPDKYYTPFTSFEDFAARSSQVPIGEDYLYRADQDPSLRIWKGAQRTTLGGLEAYLNRSSVRLEHDADIWDAEYGESWVYWIPAGNDSGILVTAFSSAFWAEEGLGVSGEHYGYQLDPMTAEVESILASLRFHPLDGTSAGTAAPGESGSSSPWRTVGSGVAAVAAAAVALAGAAASARAKSGTEEPRPDQPVGYILQLSTRSLTVSAEHSASFSAQAFKVLPSGTYQPAPDAAIVLHLPAGISVQPQTAYGTLQAVVWQTGPVAAGSAITVEGQSALGMTTASVPVAAAGESRIVTRFEPAGTLPLRTQGEHSVTLVGAVELLGADATDPALDAATICASIAFAEDSEWLEISEPADYEDGRAVTVMASQPDPTSIVQPPESATIRVTAQLGERLLNELVTIPLAGLPEIDAKPDEVMLAAESGATAEVTITITNAGDTRWQFDTAWREGSRAIASPSIEPTGPAAATLTLSENGSENLDPTRPQNAATLVVIATADGYDELRRNVDVIITQEGLFIDRTNVDPSTGAFALAADGTERPTAIDLRVFVRDPDTGDIAPDIGLAEQATLEIGGQEGTSGYAGLQVAELTVEPAGVRQLNIPSATFNVSLKRKLPTDGEPTPAALLASVPGFDTDHFSALVPVRLLGVNMEPYSDAWQTERDNCLEIIHEFVPIEYRDRLYALVAERSHTMGAEGLFLMRKQIWNFAFDQLMLQKHEHLDSAWWSQQIEDTLDWVSWCGDIALGAASGAYLGVVGSLAIGLLKPLLVSAMETWLAGGGLDDWLVAQGATLTGVLEGGLTDPDFLAKLSGDKKALGWALFIAYYFAKELYDHPEMSVTDAMKNVGRQIRDEGLIRFFAHLLKIEKSRLGGASGKKGATATATDAPTPKSADAGTADAAHARTAPGDAGTTPAKPAAATHEAPAGRTPASPDAGMTPAKPQPDAATKPGDADTGRARDAKAADAQRKVPDAGVENKPDSKPEQKPEQKTAEKPAPEKVAEKAPAGPDPRRTSADPAARAASIADDISSRTRNGKPLDPRTVDRVMTDPDAMRKLRQDHPARWKQFTEARAKTYKAHDAQLKGWIENNVPEAKGKQVEVRTVGNADGVDRDYRAGYMIDDPVTGQQRFIELRKETWTAESQKIFARETGGPTDAKGAAKWAKDRQQLATDYGHAEASVDMADQGTIYNEKTGQWEKTQLTPNADLVKQGKSTLLDPEGYGSTYETKVAEAYHEGNVLDAYKQADKMVHSLEDVRHGYDAQGYDVKSVPPDIADGIQVIKDVDAGKITPAEAETRLGSSLPEFTKKLSGQLGNLKWARKK